MKKSRKMLQNPRKFKNSPNLLLRFVKITTFLEISKKITIKTILFSNSGGQSSLGKQATTEIGLHRPRLGHFFRSPQQEPRRDQQLWHRKRPLRRG